MEGQTMKAVVFCGKYEVAVEDVPVPRIQSTQDAIVKVAFSAICGSDLHVYRGFEDCGTGTTMGHEFVGTVIEVGSAVETVKPQDWVVSPFTVSCGDCFYCQGGLSSRCDASAVFGSSKLAGAQAEYVRVPLADGTLVRGSHGLSPERLLIMADVFPTGYYGASSAFSLLASPMPASTTTAAVVGCGPVGLCAIATASTYSPQHLFAVDSVPTRLELAKSMGASPLDLSHGKDEIVQSVKDQTDSRGADIVIELVGLKPALRLAFDLLRPGGTLVSLGVHHEDYPWTLAEAYDKNLRLQFGRCPVRSIFDDSLEVFKQKQHLFNYLAETIVPLDAAPEGYKIFDRKAALKVVLSV